MSDLTNTAGNGHAVRRAERVLHRLAQWERANLHSPINYRPLKRVRLLDRQVLAVLDQLKPHINAARREISALLPEE